MRPQQCRLLAGFALLATVALALACGGEDESTSPPAITAEGQQFTASITSFQEGEVVDPGDIEVSVEVGDFKIVDKLGQPAAPGEGHVHYYLDVIQVPTDPGQPAITADETEYHAEATTSYTWQGVRPGTHTFGVQLVNNDHTPLEPPVFDQVMVTVQ